MFKFVFIVWGLIVLTSVTVTGAIIWLAYTIVTRPDLVNKWIETVTG